MTQGSDPFWESEADCLAIHLSSHAPAQAVALLERTVWGGGTLRYRIRDMAAKLGRFADPHILTLEKAGSVAAVCVLNRRRARLLDRSVGTFHFAMIATDPLYWNSNFASLLAREAARYCRETLGERGAAYAYIEGGTEFSLRISDHVGRAYEAVLPLTVFSRFSPHNDPAAGQLKALETGEVIDRLGRLYSDHLFDDFADSVNPAEYRVLRNGGEIFAGAQAELLHWSIDAMPGLVGWALMRLLPGIPGFRRWLDPADLRFLRFGNLLAEPGREGALVRLMEAMLAQHGVPLGLVMLDRRSPVYRRLIGVGNLGPLRQVVNGAVKVVADFKGLSADEIAGVQERPMLMSPLDVF